jgi:hypothetical protein
LINDILEAFLCYKSIFKCINFGVVQIKFNISDEESYINAKGYPIVPLKAPVHGVAQCHRGVGDNASTACSCQDCRTACPLIPTPPAPPPPCLVLDVDCYIFRAGCAYILFLLVFGGYSICYHILVQVVVWGDLIECKTIMTLFDYKGKQIIRDTIQVFPAVSPNNVHCVTRLVD